MTTRGGTLHAADPADVHISARERSPARLPLVVYVLALGTFLMGTTEFVVAGLLPEIAGDVQVSVARAGLMITVFAVGMIVGAPLMAMLTLRLPRRQTLVIALGVFAVGHVVVALGSSFALLLAARFLTALATGAFWSVANVVAARAHRPAGAVRTRREPGTHLPRGAFRGSGAHSGVRADRVGIQPRHRHRLLGHAASPLHPHGEPRAPPRSAPASPR